MDFGDRTSFCCSCPGEIPVAVQKREPIPTESLYAGLLKIFEEVHSELTDAGLHFDFNRNCPTDGRHSALGRTGNRRRRGRDAHSRGCLFSLGPCRGALMLSVRIPQPPASLAPLKCPSLAGICPNRNTAAAGRKGTPPPDVHRPTAARSAACSPTAVPPPL